MLCEYPHRNKKLEPDAALARYHVSRTRKIKRVRERIGYWDWVITDEKNVCGHHLSVWLSNQLETRKEGNFNIKRVR